MVVFVEAKYRSGLATGTTYDKERRARRKKLFNN